jgi:NAD(P)-dependent dehydrogenase (short-subunit alcohol dehydrogenase family)
MRSLQNQRVVVIGGTSGIGAASAQAAIALGAEVIVVGREGSKLRAAEQALGAGANSERVDAGNRTQLDALFARLGHLDHLVLSVSAGPVGIGPIAALKLDELRAAFEGKFWPYLIALQAALPHIRSRGSITMVGAASAGAALPGVAGFAAVNGALEAMVPGLAVELKPVRVNAVSPGVVDTRFWEGLGDEQRSAMFAKYASATPVGRIASPVDVGEAIVSLMANGFITGAILPVDGGLTLVGAA